MDTDTSTDTSSVEQISNKPFAQPATGVAGSPNQQGHETTTGMPSSSSTSIHQQATGMAGPSGQNNQPSQPATGAQSRQNQDMQASGGSRSMSSLSRFSRDPFALMQQMSEEMDRLFDAVFHGRYPRSSGQNMSSMPRMWSPQLEVRERGDRVVVCADLPGVNKNDVHVEVQDGMLAIHGERNESMEDNSGGFRHSERHYGSFNRTVALPEGVRPEDIHAQMKDGVLEVSFPAPQRQQTNRRVEIRHS